MMDEVENVDDVNFLEEQYKMLKGKLQKNATNGDIPHEVQRNWEFKKLHELNDLQEMKEAVNSPTISVINIYTVWEENMSNKQPFFAGLPQQFPQIRFFKMDLDKNME